MKLTENKLRQIIREEIQRLNEARGYTVAVEMDRNTTDTLRLQKFIKRSGGKQVGANELRGGVLEVEVMFNDWDDAIDFQENVTKRVPSVKHASDPYEEY